MIEGSLRKNSNGRWEVQDLELTSGHPLTILIDGHWINGSIESSSNRYYWFSRSSGVSVVLQPGLRVRAQEARFTIF